MLGNFWNIWIDTGGTFTDCLATSPKGESFRIKVLSTSGLRARIEEIQKPTQLTISQNWQAPDDFPLGFKAALLTDPGKVCTVVGFDSATSTLFLDSALPMGTDRHSVIELQSGYEAPILAARLVTGTPSDKDLPPLRMTLATTRGTNALLEQKGAEVILFITQGFEDLLEIGTQQRPDLFKLDIRKRNPLHKVSIGITERLDASGQIIIPFDPLRVEKQINDLPVNSSCAAAVVLAHSYLNPEHESQLKEQLKKKGFRWISCSTDLSRSIKLLPRAETTVVDAYLSPIMNRYLGQVEKDLPEGNLLIMTSSGGLVTRRHFHPKDSLLSGPAGGVVGAAAAGKACNLDRLISFDMGGTSTDVARFEGDFDYRFDLEIGNARVFTPCLRIETVAAGGGSICGFRNGFLHVGPESAGADPGPAMYGAGGPLTLSDVNALLGRLDSTLFGIPIDLEASQNQCETLLNSINNSTAQSLTRESLLQGYLDIADEIMADAIRKVSVREGYDPSEYTLTAFGGAGGQHACSVAQRLGMNKILIPDGAGLLSARGLKDALVERFAERHILKPFEAVKLELPQLMHQLEKECLLELEKEGYPRDTISVRKKYVFLRLKGQESDEGIDFTGNDPEVLITEFKARYESLFGYYPSGKTLEMTTIRIIASTHPLVPVPEDFPNVESTPSERNRIKGYFSGEWKSVPVYMRHDFEPGTTLSGPVIIQDVHATTIVEENWTAHCGDLGSLMLDYEFQKQTPVSCSYGSTKQPQKNKDPLKTDPVELELFTNRFGTVVEEMGNMLQRTAVSTNVKDRQDYSCALLDASGELIVNAPHIPVHLGALGICVRRIMEEFTLNPGDTIVTNHPAYGGSHLPDVTVITPFFHQSAKPAGYLANRAHHAEIGGIQPGSMSPSATCLADEGVVIPPTHLFRSGKADYETIRDILLKPPYPTRNLSDNLADLRAQVAANLKGIRSMARLSKVFGGVTVDRYMAAIKTASASILSARIRKIPDGRYAARQKMDDGSKIEVCLKVHKDRIDIDFEGTSGEHPGNFNAGPAIVQSAVIYFLRLIVDQSIPLNEGFLRQISLRIPRGMLNPCFPEDPSKCPAVVGGNVETSQRIVDTLLLALEKVACSQGTMNNLVFGNSDISYYETLCGGAGAGEGFHGADAVHTHMTNTAITDPEILEHRYAVILNRFAIRRGSGGKGIFHGGDGILREITFLAPYSLSLLTQHRIEEPYGMNGGSPGKRGKQTFITKDGNQLILPSTVQMEVQSGDRLIIETPGGGGWGVFSTEEKHSGSSKAPESSG